MNERIAELWVNEWMNEKAFAFGLPQKHLEVF